MNTLSTLTLAELKKAVSLREKIEDLQSELDKILGGTGSPAPAARTGRGKMSVAGRARVSAAQKARWAKIKGTKTAQPKSKGRRKMSAAGRAAISKAAKARWAKAKAAGKSKL